MASELTVSIRVKRARGIRWRVRLLGLAARALGWECTDISVHVHETAGKPGELVFVPTVSALLELRA